MKSIFSSLIAVAGLWGIAGCETSDHSGDAVVVPHDATPAPPAPRVDVQADDGNVNVNVGPPGEKPGVDVDVRPGGNVDVDIDGEKIRERLQERREERQEQREELRETAPPQ